MRKTPKQETEEITEQARIIRNIREEMLIDLKEYRECLNNSNWKEITIQDGCYRAGQRTNYCGD